MERAKVSLPDDVMAWYELQAARLGLSLSSLLRLVAMAWYEEHQADQVTAGELLAEVGIAGGDDAAA